MLAVSAAPLTTGASPAADAGRFRIRFDEHLGLSDLRLTGPSASRGVVFTRDARWVPQAGSTLHLVLGHSPGLDAERSFLTITLNGGILRSLRLDGASEEPTEVVVSIPPEMIRRSNELRLGAVQSAEGGAETWTTVGARSFVDLAFRETSVPATLADLPLPLVDPVGPRPLRMAVLVPSRLSPASLEATALVIANLASRSAPRALELDLIGGTDDPVPTVVVGTLIEQRGLRKLVGPEVSVREGGRGPVLAVGDGPPLGPSSGLVGLARDGPGQVPVLYVTGNMPEDVLRAAWAVAAVPLQGKRVTVSGEPEWVPRRRREWRGFAPARARFSMTDLGHGGAPLLVHADAPVRIPVRAMPDVRFLTYGHRVRISAQRLPALLEQPGGTLEVAWNGIVLRKVAAPDLPRKPRFALDVALPVETMRRDNVLELAWTGSGAVAPLLAVDPDGTQWYWPREYDVRLPDLALLQSSFYPFSVRPDFSDVFIVLPDRITEEVFDLVCELSAYLGRVLPTDRVALRVRQASALTPHERASAHLIVVRTSRGPDPFAVAFPDPRAIAKEGSLDGAPVVQQAVSPWNDEKYVLSLRAASGSALLRALRTLTQPPVLSALKGDTAFLTAGGPVCFTVGTPRPRREISYVTRAEAYLRSHWLVLPAIMALASALGFVALRLALAQRKTYAAGGTATWPAGAERD